MRCCGGLAAKHKSKKKPFIRNRCGLPDRGLFCGQFMEDYKATASFFFFLDLNASFRKIGVTMVVTTTIITMGA